jgi:diguanylate cyclase (GGDEF)-like protein/PAS domain S-box-containing protein
MGGDAFDGGEDGHSERIAELLGSLASRRDPAGNPALDFLAEEARELAHLANFGDEERALGSQYLMMVEASPYGICVHQHGVVVFANSTFTRFLGAEVPGEIIGRPITECVVPESQAALLARIGSLTVPGAWTKRAEANLRKLDGGSLTVESQSVLTTWKGQPGYQVIMRDLTAKKAVEAALRFQAALIGHVSDAIIATSIDGTVTSWNPAAVAVYGRSAEDTLNRPVSEVVGAPLDPRAVVRAGGVQEATHQRADGVALAIHVSAAEMSDGYVLLCADKTAQRRAEKHFAIVIESLDEGVVVVNPSGRIELANAAAHRIVGVEDRALIGLKSGSFPLYDESGGKISLDESRAARVRVPGTPETGQVVQLRRPDGARRWLSLASRPLATGETVPSVVTSFTDITDRRAIGERLKYEATHDPLTQLANRTFALNHLRRTMADPGVRTTVLFIDLDKFKMTNDSLGHSVGDQVLRITGERLNRAVASPDLVGRLGGDEFVVITTGYTDQGEVRALADHLQRHVVEPLTVHGRQLHINANIGIVMAGPGDGRTADEVLEDADLAMYQAKTHGPGRHAFYAPEMREPIQRRLGIEQDLRDAVGSGQLTTVHQPIVDLSSGDTVAAEALLRWHHPVRGDVNPAELIAVAEESDLILTIGANVLKTATLEIARWRAAHGLNCYANVNLSLRQLADPRLLPLVRDALAVSGLPAESLCLEVTEGALQGGAAVLRALRELGVQVAIDDFGAGYSSLAQLHHLDLNAIKIDGSFSTGLGLSADAEPIVAGIIAMAHAVDLTVVAEGVENARQLEALRELGCDRVQGFLVARPGTVDDLLPRYRKVLRQQG